MYSRPNILKALNADLVAFVKQTQGVK